MPFGKAQTMLVEQVRVFEDVVENELQHESLVVPPAEEPLVVLCHLVSVLHRPQSASGWDKIAHAEHTEKAGTKKPRFFVPALVDFVFDFQETECGGLFQSSSSTSTILYFFCFFAPVAIAD